MNLKPNPEAEAKVADALGKLKELQIVLGKTPTLDLPFPTLVSHVRDHQQDIQRLVLYGHQVVGSRSMEFALLTSIKAYWNIQMYLDGDTSDNPLALPSAARAQIELFAIAWHVFDIISANGGHTKPDLANRMLIVDEALIMAIHGSRDSNLAEVYKNLEPSKIRPTNERDLEVFKAKNILTRIQKADSGSEYTTCWDDYDRLSDLLHPNGMQNMLFRTFSPKGEGHYRLGLRDPQFMRRARYHSVHAMLNASAEILRLVSDTPDPFKISA